MEHPGYGLHKRVSLSPPVLASWPLYVTAHTGVLAVTSGACLKWANYLCGAPLARIKKHRVRVYICSSLKVPRLSRSASQTNRVPRREFGPARFATRRSRANQPSRMARGGNPRDDARVSSWRFFTRTYKALRRHQVMQGNTSQYLCGCRCWCRRFGFP